MDPVFLRPSRSMRSGAIRSVRELQERGLIGDGDVGAIQQVVNEFSLAITAEMAELIEPNQVSGPIAKQFVPSESELIESESDLADPIGDDRHSPVKGIVHRHNDRVLLKLVHLCAVYCRFCFRRETLGSAQSKNLSEAELETALDYIRRNEEIWEVILTGGDPLVLAPRRLQRVIGALAAISHVKIIRIHTRVPVVDPSRIDDEMVAALTSDKPVYVVLHANHARELTPNAKAAIAKLAFAGVPLLSQSVLLRGVNDSEEALKDLFRALLENRVKPYYLHHGDLARGTSHFRTTIEEGQRLFGALRAKISGIGLPRYVLDIPGGWGKVSIEASHLTATPDGYLVRDDAGQLHEYRCM